MEVLGYGVSSLPCKSYIAVIGARREGYLNSVLNCRQGAKRSYTNVDIENPLLAHAAALAC